MNLIQVKKYNKGIFWENQILPKNRIKIAIANQLKSLFKRWREKIGRILNEINLSKKI